MNLYRYYSECEACFRRPCIHFIPKTIHAIVIDVESSWNDVSRRWGARRPKCRRAHVPIRDIVNGAVCSWRVDIFSRRKALPLKLRNSLASLAPSRPLSRHRVQLRLTSPRHFESRVPLLYREPRSAPLSATSIIATHEIAVTVSCTIIKVRESPWVGIERKSARICV